MLVTWYALLLIIIYWVKLCDWTNYNDDVHSNQFSLETLYLSVTEGTATIKTDSSAMTMMMMMMMMMMENAMRWYGADRIVLKRYVNVFKTDKLTGCYGQWTSSFWLVQSHSFTQDIIIKRSVLVAMVTLLNESYYHVTSLAQSHSFTQYIIILTR